MKKVAIHTLKNPTHPIIELDIGKFIRQEFHRRFGMVGLELGNGAFLQAHANLILSECDLLRANADILLGKNFLKLPILFAAFVASDLV